MASIAFAEEAFSAMAVANGHQLGRLLAASTTTLNFDEKPPGIFARLALHGTPRLSLALSHDHVDASWMSALRQKTEVPFEVPSMPIWRLLDPAPISRVELAGFEHSARGFMFKLSRQKQTGVEVEYLEIIPTAFDRSGTSRFDDKTYPIRWESPSTLVGLQLMMLGLRRYELEADLVGYYLSLCTLIKCCQHNRSCALGRMFSLCQEHLVECFAGVHLTEQHHWRVKYERSRLEVAFDALKAVIPDVGLAEPNPFRQLMTCSFYSGQSFL